MDCCEEEDSRSEHVPGRVHPECSDDGVEEIHNVLVFPVTWAVACDVESRCAGGVFGEL